MPGTAARMVSSCRPIASITSSSGPATLMPTGVFMPVASMSIRVLIGITQALVTPGSLTRASSSRRSDSVVTPSRHSSRSFQLDKGLDHGQRRRIGGGVGPADLAEYGCDLGHGADQLVGLLQQFARLADGYAGIGGRHVHQIALIQRRNKLAADFVQRPERAGQHGQGNQDRRFGKVEDFFQHGQINGLQKPG